MDKISDLTPHQRRYKGKNKHMKRCSTLFFLRNCKLKQWVKSKKLTLPFPDKNEEQWELFIITSRNDNRTATLEGSLAVSYKAKHSFTRWSHSNAPMCVLN